jgi:hypothetical protein
VDISLSQSSNRQTDIGDFLKMRTFGRLLSVSVVLSLSSFPVRAQNTCHAADMNSARFIQSLNSMMAPDASAFRAKLQMSLVSPSQIVLVSDSTTCARAGLAQDSIVKIWVPTARHPPTTAPLYVIQIGTSFAVADLNSPRSGSEYGMVLIFGPLWEYRGSIGM